MQLLLALLAASAALPLPSLARPDASLVSRKKNCGHVRDFYDPTPEKWEAANTDAWLSDWWSANEADVEESGFAEAFTRYTLDVEGFTCKLSGNPSNCVADTCNNPVLNKMGDDLEPAYYVLSSLKLFHGYLKGYQETVESAAVVESFNQDIFTKYFYLDPNEIDSTSLKEMINILVTILSLGSAGVGFLAKLGKLGSLAVGAGVTMAGAAQTEAFLRIETKAPDVFEATANSGYAMSKALKETFTSIFGLNDNLMAGKEIKEEGGHNSGDLRQFLKGGRWVNAPELDKVNGLDVMTGALQSVHINTLWKQQSVFIMGGGSCGDGDGIGTGPKDQEGSNYWCDDNDKAWYLYFYQSEGDKAWLSRPWGSDRVGELSLLEQQGSGSSDFPLIKITNIIKSSITSHKVANNNYDSAVFSSRMADIMKDGADPLAELTAMEGLWTIPVCDVSGAIGSDMKFKSEILMPYGYDSVPQWCGNICGNDEATTNEFYEKARLTDQMHFAYKAKCEYTNWPGADD